MKTELFQDFLTAKKEECLNKAKRLQEEERHDDAIFYKAKSNIYDVYAALFNASDKKTAGDDERLIMEFSRLAGSVSKKWEVALEAAKSHEDAKKILLEETKLLAVNDIMTKFNELWEV